MSSIILNNINGIEDYTYLELGVAQNANFSQIKCVEKYSVDTNGYGMFTGTTDEYFSQLSKTDKFDIIFIDANHNYEHVLTDFNNAVDHANKWVLIHDMIPPNKDFTIQSACSDSYKLLYYFLLEEDFELYSTIENYGLTFIKMPAKKVYPNDNYKNADYDEFMTHIKNNIKLYSEVDLVKYFNEGNKF